MKERPILFSGPMVRAILSGTKTQTRRVVKPQPPAEFCTGDVAPITNGTRWSISKMPERKAWHPDPDPGILCPYGQPGDRLWVREAWQYGIHSMSSKRDEDGPFVYAADRDEQHRLHAKWVTSIHMPRWASRITLEVTGVRVERLQDISQRDAMEEGGPPSHPSIDAISREYGYTDFPRSWYAQLWEQINGPGSWAANPWVWVVEFKRVQP